MQELDRHAARRRQGPRQALPALRPPRREELLPVLAELPGDVAGAASRQVAKTAATRWGLKALRWTSAKAGVQDGFNVAGFSTSCPRGMLGVQTDYVKRGKVVERDLALRAGENWAAGPGLSRARRGRPRERRAPRTRPHGGQQGAHARAARTRR